MRWAGRYPAACGAVAAFYYSILSAFADEFTPIGALMFGAVGLGFGLLARRRHPSTRREEEDRTRGPNRFFGRDS
jgi:hypothetical protein